MRYWLVVSLLFGFGCGDDVASDPAGTEGADSTSTTTGEVDPGSTGAGTTSSESTGALDTTAGTTGEPPPPPLEWSDECITAGSDFGNLHPRMECTAIDVPLDWADPEGETITIATFRVRSEAAERRGAFWMLDGGPGGSGIAFFLDSNGVDELNAEGWDLVVHSHRGTLAPRLECAGEPTGPACLAELEGTWGDGLQHFNTVQAAHDQAELMRRAAVDDDGLAVVYGVSYGSYWGQFLLGLHPDVADAVILDSVLGAYTSVATQEAAIDERMLNLLQECVDDPICGARVGYTSGSEFAQAVIDAFDNGDCGPTDDGPWAATSFKGEFGAMLNTGVARNYLPLLAALLARCTPEESSLVAGAIDQIFGRIFSAAPGPGTPQAKLAEARARSLHYGVSPDVFGSSALFPVVVSTTMLPDDVDIQVGANVLATTGLPSAVAGAHEFFGPLPDVAFDADFVPEVPVLILNANYDLQTPFPWATAVADQYGVEVIAVPDGQHSVFSPGNGGRTVDGAGCIRPLVFGFAAAPGDPLEDACLESLPQVDVNLTRPDLVSISKAVFGLEDPWTLVE
ncbi:MAG: hypothetical protein AAF721_04930 [Myxococcota bacterium]